MLRRTILTDRRRVVLLDLLADEVAMRRGGIDLATHSPIARLSALERAPLFGKRNLSVRDKY